MKVRVARAIGWTIENVRFCNGESSPSALSGYCPRYPFCLIWTVEGSRSSLMALYRARKRGRCFTPTTMTVLPLHPLDPLSPTEITSVSTAVRSFILNGKTATQALPASCKVKFAYVTLVEPLKSEVIAYLGLATSPTDLQPHKSSGRPIRRAECAIIAPTLGRVFVFLVQLGVDETVVESFEKLDEEVQIGITNEELLDAEHAVRTDSRVIQLCADVGQSLSSRFFSFRADLRRQASPPSAS